MNSSKLRTGILRELLEAPSLFRVGLGELLHGFLVVDEEGQESHAAQQTPHAGPQLPQKQHSRNSRGPKDHINIRIRHSGSKAQYQGDTGNHGLWDPYVYVVFYRPYYLAISSPGLFEIFAAVKAISRPRPPGGSKK